MNMNWQYTVEYPQDGILLNVANTEQALDSAVDFLKGKAEELRKPVLTPRQEAIIAYARERGYDPIEIEGDEYYEIRTEDSPDGKEKLGDRWYGGSSKFKVLHEWTERYIYKGQFYIIGLYAYNDVQHAYTSMTTHISPSYS